ncbi:MAG: universal stress protein [Halobacteriaceae archaeon]
MYGTILVPTDGSEGAARATEHAVELAATYGATVHALNVVEPAYSTDFNAGELRASLEAAGEEAVEAVADRAAEAGVEAVTAVVEGDPHREILSYAEAVDADLVVMGTHGRTGLDRYLLGSVAERVVRTADAPVLTVHLD